LYTGAGGSFGGAISLQIEGLQNSQVNRLHDLVFTFMENKIIFKIFRESVCRKYQQMMNFAYGEQNEKMFKRIYLV
jgi:cephalosporin-C deacetylase-like acetyl esterase